MFVYGWSVLGLRFGLLILSFYPMGSFVLRVGVDSIQFNSILYSHYSFYREIKENNINLQEKVIPVEIVSLQLKNMCVVAEGAKAFVSATTTLK